VPDDRDHREIGRLADEVVPALIARLEASSLGELEVREGGWRIRLRREAGSVSASVAPSGESGRRRRRGGSSAVGEPRGGSGARAGEEPAPTTLGPVRASAGAGGAGASESASMRAVGPGLGDGSKSDRDAGDGLTAGPGARTAEGPAERRTRLATAPAVGYYQPAAELATGQQVETGDVLGHVDVLGVRQEVVAPTTGIVSRLLAQPGQAVEYGQELVQIEPVSRSAAVGTS
jgi:biotin carboxyl carrier protein